MKNIQIIDNAVNCVYDLFAAIDEEFSLIFPNETNIAFINEVYERGDEQALGMAFKHIRERRIEKVDAMGIHGTLFYGLDEKRIYYPTRKDKEAINPNGSKLRNG